MEPLDAGSFLANISGFKDPEMEDKVAEVLGYQPLALASAGTYVKEIRENMVPNFGWKEYLDKLDRGKRVLTEKTLTKTNPIYSMSMTVARRLAVVKAIGSDNIMKNAVTFLSLCAHKALHLDILINYVLNIDKQVEREELAVQIQGYSLLLLEKRENGVFIGVHQVTYEVIKSVINESRELPDDAQAVHGAVIAFNQYIDTELSETWNELNSIASSKHLTPHLKALATKVEDVFDTQNKLRVLGEKAPNELFRFERLGQISKNYCELSDAKLYYDITLKLVEMTDGSRGNKATVLHKKGILQYQMGNLQQAKENLNRALDILLKKLGPEQVHVARTYNSLGSVQQEVGDLQQDKENHEHALHILLKRLGPEHVDIVYTYNNLEIGRAHV